MEKQTGCTQLSEKKKDYFCPKCDFTSSWVNVVICHMKHHGKDTDVSIKKIRKKKVEKIIPGSTEPPGNTHSKVRLTKHRSWKKNERSAVSQGDRLPPPFC